MSEEKELKLACLHQAGGDLDHAQRLFDWVSGSVRATPDSEAAEVSAPKQDKPEQPFNYQHPSKYGTDVPRRCYLEELTPEERAIRDLVGAIEHLGAHPLLTTTVIPRRAPASAMRRRSEDSPMAVRAMTRKLHRKGGSLQVDRRAIQPEGIRL
mgnify:CR=1 FL=1